MGSDQNRSQNESSNVVTDYMDRRLQGNDCECFYWVQFKLKAHTQGVASCGFKYHDMLSLCIQVHAFTILRVCFSSDALILTT